MKNVVALVAAADCAIKDGHNVAGEPRDDVTTATYVIDEQTGELRPVDVGDVAAEAGALVIRSGGGRVGQSFPLHGERMTIGRSPDAKSRPAALRITPTVMSATP